MSQKLSCPVSSYKFCPVAQSTKKFGSGMGNNLMGEFSQIVQIHACNCAPETIDELLPGSHDLSS